MSGELYTLKGSQIVLHGTVAADLHGMATEAGRRRAAVILRALNAPERAGAELRAIRAGAQSLAESGEATEDNVRALAHLIARLCEEVRP